MSLEDEVSRTLDAMSSHRQSREDLDAAIDILGDMVEEEYGTRQGPSEMEQRFETFAETVADYLERDNQFINQQIDYLNDLREEINDQGPTQNPYGQNPFGHQFTNNGFGMFQQQTMNGWMNQNQGLWGQTPFNNTFQNSYQQQNTWEETESSENNQYWASNSNQNFTGYVQMSQSMNGQMWQNQFFI